MKVMVGHIALRSPSGEFIPAVPIYEELPENDQLDGLTEYEKIKANLFAHKLVSKFEEYIKKIKEVSQCQ